MGNFFCVVCELDDFVDDDDRAFQRQHNQRKKQLKDQQEALSYGLILMIGEPIKNDWRINPNQKTASEMEKR